MKKTFLFILFAVFIISCNKDKEYIYILVNHDYDSSGNQIEKVEDPIILHAPNDSVAYCMAVDSFIIGFYKYKINKLTMEVMDVKYPKQFILLRSDSTDISNGEYLKNPIAIIDSANVKYEKMAKEYKF
ncbi:MAG: hypothetical protein LBV43_13420 [Prevotella sp.]|jgi:hypothetical protein|nr:hypothetical protein [Prevotella sp.]